MFLSIYAFAQKCREMAAGLALTGEKRYNKKYYTLRHAQRPI